MSFITDGFHFGIIIFAGDSISILSDGGRIILECVHHGFANDWIYDVTERGLQKNNERDCDERLKGGE